MPMTPFQREVLLLLKSSRNPESYVAGGTAIQRAANSIRYSRDIDFFHDTDEAVTQAFTNDQKTLLEHNYKLHILISQPSFYRATVTKGKDALKLEWVRDTVFRFFPVIEDEDLGYRLHDIDLAINKCIALANRTEIRDILDILDLHERVIPLHCCIWAACGKDPGFTPELIIEMIQRHANITPDLLAVESLARPLDPVDLKKRFQMIFSEAKELIKKFNANDLGCIYLDNKGKILKGFDRLNQKNIIKHFGSIKGGWPRTVER